MKQMSERFLTDQDLANLYSWNNGRRRYPEPTNANGASLHCYTSTSEMYQKNDCYAKGAKEPQGINFKGLNGQIVADWIIGNWVNIRD